MTHDEKIAELEILERRARIAELFKRGHTLAKIGLEVGLDKGTVSRELQAIRKGYKDQAEADEKEGTAGRRLERMEELDAAKQEAWEAWRRSQAPKKKKGGKKIKGTGGDGQGVREETSASEEGRDGNAKFLGEVRACIAEQAKLEGLYKDPKKADSSNGPVVKVYIGDWGDDL